MGREPQGVIRAQFGRQRPDLRGTMPTVTDLTALGWTHDRAAELPDGTAAARVARVDRGLLTVLAADGERRVRPASALYDEAGLGSPAGGGRGGPRGGVAGARPP